MCVPLLELDEIKRKRGIIGRLYFGGLGLGNRSP